MLFEYIDSQWRERGRGEMKMNVGVGDKARLVMRQRGNLRLLLNANIFPLFKLTPMDGGKVRNTAVYRSRRRPKSWLYACLNVPRVLLRSCMVHFSVSLMHVQIHAAFGQLVLMCSSIAGHRWWTAWCTCNLSISCFPVSVWLRRRILYCIFIFEGVCTPGHVFNV